MIAPAEGIAGESLEGLQVKVFEVEQPIGTFYVGVMKASALREIAYADTRRQSEREIESYSGIQRELSERRRIEIRQYISTFDAAFPNSFIIAVKSEHVLRQEDGVLILRQGDDTASLIDGQHRLAGFDEHSDDGFDLIVAIFIDLPLEDQAMIFATINIKQTRVNPSLVYDLFEETKARSPQKTCHNISKSLNTDKTSPFYHQIKPLGKRTEEFRGRLTQATFVKQLLPLVCINPDTVRDRIKRGEQLDANDSLNRDRVFWRFFAEDKDWAILRAVTNYFNAVRAVFPEDWATNDSPLARTIGFSALIRLLEKIARNGLAATPEPRLDQSFFEQNLRKAQHLAPFSFEIYSASGAGETKLFRALEKTIFSPENEQSVTAGD
jgi:DGQHR domain-containing protein